MITFKNVSNLDTTEKNKNKQKVRRTLIVTVK